MSASWGALERFDAAKEAARTTIWKSGCKSWYLDRNGVPMAWPWTFDRFLEGMRAPRLEATSFHASRDVLPRSDRPHRRMRRRLQ